MERKVVIPGEVIVSGEDYLPGEGTEKRGQEIVAIRYGLAEESSSLVKVIALSGIYQPRRGNVVIGKVENITFNGWVVDINSPTGAFLPLAEVPRFVSKDEMSEVLDIGDMLVAKILGVNGRGIDLTIKMRGLGKIRGHDNKGKFQQGSKDYRKRRKHDKHNKKRDRMQHNCRPERINLD